MRRADILEIRRKLDERKAGFLVELDPWELAEGLLDEVQHLEARLNTAFNCGYVEP